MCGIATIAIGRRSRGRVPYPLVRKLAKGLLIELQDRGQDAAGIAVINEGADSVVFKKPLKPDRFAIRPMFEQVLNAIGPKTNFVMLHARATTVGSSSDNFNNHPIVVEPVVGIHNGTLYNDSALFNRHRDSFEREGNVDSEVIFKLWLHFVEEGQSPEKALESTSDLLHGAFTGALVDMRNPHLMLMFKNERPLSIFRFPHFDVSIAVSGPQYYAAVARDLGIRSQALCSVVEDGTGITFDLNARERITKKISSFKLPVQEFDYVHHRSWLMGGGWG
jgi:glucosamine 6-phosphate synthetase-like amidotransferase/phosphosugar isomerase protein